MSVRDKGMSRGSFLRLFAAAPIAGAAVAQSAFTKAALAATLPTSAMTLNFHCSGNSYRINTAEQAEALKSQKLPVQPYADRLVFGGSGQITGQWQVGKTVSQGQVNAQGSFTHYEDNLPPGQNIPAQFTGTWIATNLVSFELLGFWGPDAAGIYPLAAGALVLDILLVRPKTTSIPLTQVPSQLTLISNLKGLKDPKGQFESKIPSLGAKAFPLPDGITLLAPNSLTQGFYFIPVPFESTLDEREGSQGEDDGGYRKGGPRPMEAHTPVLFSTLNESRQMP
jgi:hypothetical protein